MSNATVGVEIVTWEAAAGDTFTLSREGIEVRVKETYPEAGDEIEIEVLGRLVPLQVACGRRSCKYFLLGRG